MISPDKSGFKYKAKMKEVVAKIDDLPTLPSVVTKLMEMSEDSKSSAEDIAKVITLDPALTAKILKIANSAYYGFRQRASSLDGAIVTLGLKVVKSLALNVSVIEAFSSTGVKGEFDKKKFWEHSIGCAVISKLLAKRAGYSYVELEEAFTAGLLHDIGKIILDRYLHDEFGSVVRMAMDENIAVIEAEEKILGIDHTEVGHWLAFMWKLPEELQWVIYSHHNPELAVRDARKLTSIVTLVIAYVVKRI